MADATAREQLILEMINRARMDPEGEAARYGISLNQGLSAGTISSAPKQVLAFNPELNDAADSHSGWMLDTDTFSHTGVGGSSPGQRMTSAGYEFTGSWTWGENIAWSGSTGSYSGDQYAATHHKNLFLSAGHRTNILNDNFREVGIGSVTGSFKSGTTTYNALMTTENFAKSGSNIFVTGVTYNDTDNDDFYSIGEGQGSRTVTLLQNGGTVATTTSAAAGGFSLGTTVTGPVEVRFSGGGLAATMGVAVSLAGKNVKVDLVDGNTIQSNVTAELTQSSVNLTLLGIENVNGGGNDLANTITGNKGNNTLSGNGGNDTLIGGAGVDIYLGGNGDDTIRAESNDNLAQSSGGDGFDKLYITGSAPSGFDFAANGFEELWVNGVLVGSTDSPPPPPPPLLLRTPPPPPPPPPPPSAATEGDDELLGTAGNDTISALGGNDYINGAAGSRQHDRRPWQRHLRRRQFRRRGERDGRKRNRHGAFLCHLQPGEHHDHEGQRREPGADRNGCDQCHRQQPGEHDRRKLGQQCHVRRHRRRYRVLRGGNRRREGEPWDDVHAIDRRRRQ